MKSSNHALTSQVDELSVAAFCRELGTQISATNYFTSLNIASLISPPLELTNSESVSESELLYDWLFTANQFVLAPTP
jgi:hypothetical protein